jgi:fibro-slime domain-containing protein
MMRAMVAVFVAWLSSVPMVSAGVTLSGTVRDFQMLPVASQTTPNPDFENQLGDDRGIVTNTLGLDGKPVYNTAAHPLGTATTFGNGGISATTFFNQWFNDTPGYNIPIATSITLDPIGGGLFQYSNNAFFPIDGLGFGNQGQPHNYSFTLEIHTLFGYTGSGVLDFSGDDDVFVYINNQLVIDLGGVHGVETAGVDVSTLGLTPGNNYSLDVFYAERHTVLSDFTMTTDLAFTTRTSDVPEPGALLVWTLVAGVFGIGGWQTRLKNRAASIAFELAARP